LAPKDNISRAEAVKLIDNIAGELKNSAGTYTGNVEKNLVVNTGSVILKDMVVNGDLFLAQGIGDGDVTLDNVTVKGRTVVRGGGENSIIINNSNLEGTLVVIKVGGVEKFMPQFIGDDFDMSYETIRRILNSAALQPHRVRYYLNRTDPDFVAKALDVIRLYEQHCKNPDSFDLLCINEKLPVIQN